MQRHTQIGYELLAGSGSPLLELAANLALTHHERWDGQGYPRNLAGEQIPVEARILAVADVFDALTSARVYRSRYDIDTAVAVMRGQTGEHFDPTVLDAFVASLDEVREIHERFADKPLFAIADHQAAPGQPRGVDELAEVR
jgi:putative two-component system response regulator